MQACLSWFIAIFLQFLSGTTPLRREVPMEVNDAACYAPCLMLVADVIESDGPARSADHSPSATAGRIILVVPFP
jgi:hypothetical protein